MEGYSELTVESLKTPEGVRQLSRMLVALFEHISSDGHQVRVYYGYGSPEGVVYANIGSLYMRKDGGAGSTVYAKEANNDAATGWSAL